MAHKITAKRIIALLLTFVLTFGATALSVNGTIKVSAAEKTINGCKYLTETADYKMYVNEEDLSLVIEDKQSGAYMTSAIEYDDEKNNATWLGAMKSAVVITMISGSDDTKQADLINDNVTKKVTYTDNGFVAELYWVTYQFGLTLEVELTEDGLLAKVQDDSIVEDGEKYFIGTISLYPYMGNSYLDDKTGYMLVPDGNGALIYLDDKDGRFKSGFSKMIYGGDVGFDESNVQTLLNDKYNTIKDSEEVIAPVFGMAHTDDGIAYLGIVEEGEARASIECIPNGASVDYNRAYAKFTLRKTYTQPTSNNSTAGSLHVYETERSHSDLAVRYIFLGGDDANYTGMATAYRDYLLSNGGLGSDDNSFRTRIDFLGTDRESFLLGTSSVVMTTVDDIYEIYDELEGEGVNDILTVYKGWQKKGLYSVPITSYKADSKIGGTSKLTKLIKDAGERNIQMYLYNDALRINPDERNATFNVVKQINKRRFEESTYKSVYSTMNYLIPARTMSLLNSFINKYVKSGVDKLALAGVSNKLFSYTYSGNSYTRYDTQNTYKDMVEQAAQKTSLVLEQPFAYLWSKTDAFLDMPLYTSSYIFEDESVPFLSIVLKGVMPMYSEYVNFEANKQEFFLKLVETGVYPSFYITKESSSKLLYTNSSDIYSSEYATYKNTIVEYYKELEALSEKTAGSTVVKHEIVDGDIRVVTYSNGVTVYINYGTKTADVDGVTIESMSYEVR